MKKIILLLAVVCSFMLVSQVALAEGMFEITDVENKNGSIGLHIKSEYSTSLDTDPSETNTSVLKYYVDNEEVSILANKSAGTLPAGKERFIVLDKSWPSSGYYPINITFADDQGTMYPTHTTTAIFAKEGLEKIGSEAAPERATTDDNIVLKVKLKAGGEGDISNINVDVDNPSYLVYEEKEISNYLSEGETDEFVFKYKPSGGSLPDTVIFKTSRALINVSYSYLGQDTQLELNESIIIFNKYQIGDKLPNVTTWLEMPEEVVPGSTINVSAYAQNVNSEGHSACSLNFTLSSENSGIEIPIYTILPGEKLLGTLVEPVEPEAVFEVEIKDGASLGNSDFTLKTTYKDCEWNAPFKTETTGSTKIVQTISEPEENETEEVNETETNETEENETTEETEETPADEETEESGPSFRERAPVKFYLILGLAAFLVIGGVVAFLEWRSRFI
ncbi:MAG: hypothetical protein R6U26_04375 [Candidatus Undinarchaeales archaeon]